MLLLLMLTRLGILLLFLRLFIYHSYCFAAFLLGFGFIVKWHINLHGLFNVKAIIAEEQ